MVFTSTIPLKFGSKLVIIRTQVPKPLSLSSSHRCLQIFTSHSSVGRQYCGLRLRQTRLCSSAKRDDPLGTEEICKNEAGTTNNLEDSEKMGKENLSTDRSSSIRNVALWVSAAALFGIALGFKEGIDKASEFFAGYLLEQSLSVDNLFVFVLVFKYFKVPVNYQNRVLSYGITGAVIFRAIMILLGTATLQRFEAVNLFLASILLYSSYKLFASEEEETDLADNFIVKTCKKFIPVTANYDSDRFITIQDSVWKATPLFLTVVVIELSDIAFAVDSIPAVFGVTRDPFIVFTSNMFAISGLRSLYLLISERTLELEYLQRF